ncbi:MAG: 8-amino-7-oxononanoate synthase [Muribaculaceae bacterium]|nr:8-amino-7-oxononanoate synthase [Muribaculaceae bacterium]
MIADRFADSLSELSKSGNLRHIPDDAAPELIDLSSNDYLGLATRSDLEEEFLAGAQPSQLCLSSSASRLLAANQSPYFALEKALSALFRGRDALLFNSGYHANSGIIPALTSSKTLILADKLVHASIIDGIKLSGARFTRFRHNDLDHLKRLIENAPVDAELLVIVESVYSMDGDKAPLQQLVELKQHFADRMLLYVDEAHAFGVEGEYGSGLCETLTDPGAVDIIVGTLGKAAASSGAFAITSPVIKAYLVNKSRSLIFSTAIPPITAAWSEKIVRLLPELSAERSRLKDISARIAEAIGSSAPSHILPYIVGDPAQTILLSKQLAQKGVKVLPIRTPTVPPGTERLRISLSAGLTDNEVARAVNALKTIGRPQ